MSGAGRGEPAWGAARYLAVDIGDRRTGLAVGDARSRLAIPIGVLEVPLAQRDGEELVEAVAAAARAHLGDPPRGALVVGLPVNMDGTEGTRARAMRGLAARLGARTGLEVHLQDERLTSAAADWSMARSGLTRGQKKARRDALAAAAILGDFLARLGQENAPSGPEAGDGC
ncbi:MAG TPA: Holliday junction resolvase RuvX [Phycisphaerales bacterium]|nr:Holliday junction resolvase RuvX [Phycisphaerales bacterium]